jgi:hypothetical protein
VFEIVVSTHQHLKKIQHLAHALFGRRFELVIVFGVERTVLCTFNRPLFVAQTKTLRREIRKRRRRLGDCVRALDRFRTKSRGKAPTMAGTQKRVEAILAGRHMKQLFHAEVSSGPDKLPVLSWRFDDEAWRRLQNTLLGGTILFTDRDGWTDQKLRVHAFYCVLALTILSLLRRKLAQKGIHQGNVKVPQAMGRERGPGGAR